MRSRFPGPHIETTDWLERDLALDLTFTSSRQAVEKRAVSARRRSCLSRDLAAVRVRRSRLDGRAARICPAVLRVLEVRVVEDVVDASADVQLHTLSDGKVLAKGEVRGEEARPTILVAHLGWEEAQTRCRFKISRIEA